MTTLPIPDKALAQHVILLGKTRSGKSSTMRLIVERLLDEQKPVCIIDPKGDWWGLKSSASGARAGYPVVIFGGEHADVPLNVHAAAHVAELVATGNRPCIIDLGGWLVSDRTKFFVAFASALFRKTRGPRWLAIDEVHNFAPQGKVLDPDAGKMLHWANRLASEGAGKGVTLISASQRPQKVHKDYVTSHETLIAKRVIHPLDRNAVKDWIDGCGDPAMGKEVIASLAGISREEGWVWSPEIGFGPKLIKFPMFSTYDSFAAPTGEAVEKLKGWASVDLEEVKTKLAAVLEEAKANDPKELKADLAKANKRIAELERTVAEKRADPGDAQIAYDQGFTDASNKGVRAMRDLTDTFKEQIAEIVRLGSEFAGVISKRLADGSAIAERMYEELAKLPARPTPEHGHAPMPTQRPPRAAHEHPRSAARETNGSIAPTTRKILDVIHRAHPVALSFATASKRASVSKRSSALRIYRQQVEASDEVQMRDDGKLVSLRGRSVAVGPDINAVDEFAKRLPPSYAAMLRVIEIAEAPLTREEIATRAQVSATSSGLGSGLRELLALGLIEERDGGYALHRDLS